MKLNMPSKGIYRPLELVKGVEEYEGSTPHHDTLKSPKKHSDGRDSP
jgi:hypothetical protein